MGRARDIALVVIALVWCAVCLGMLLLGIGCSVYEEPTPCGRAHPGGGVIVRLAELGEADGGAE